MRHHLRRLLLVGFIALPAACRPEFNPKSYAGPDQLYAAGLKEYKASNWDNAAKAFEQLTRDLPARDPLLPLSYYYLGESQKQQGDYLLAAQSLSRIADAFPEDTLAPQALFEAGKSYEKMWRRPELDPTYGNSATTTFQSLIALYPDTPFVLKATAELKHLDAMFATKDYETGYHYLRRDAFDSAIIYFKDVIRLHPNAPAARLAYLHLLEAYRAINYKDDARDLCDAMRKNYPNDREVNQACGSASSAAASTRPM